MKTSLRLLTIASSAVLLSFSTAVLTPFYTESTDGDLSNQFDNPTGPFTLAVGDNQITADQQSSDVDYFSITVPTGFELDQLILEGYTVSDPNNQAFLGMQAGTAFTTDASSTTAADLLGGIIYGSQDLDTNLLVDMNNIGQGFDIPLEAGVYTFWLNQTGANSELTLNFVISDNLGLDENTLENLVHIFPNPVIETLTIQSKASIHLKSLSIIDITGKEVRRYKNPTAVDLQTLSAGVYFGKIETDQGTLTTKIIKQ